MTVRECFTKYNHWYYCNRLLIIMTYINHLHIILYNQIHHFCCLQVVKPKQELRFLSSQNVKISVPLLFYPGVLYLQIGKLTFPAKSGPGNMARYSSWLNVWHVRYWITRKDDHNFLEALLLMYHYPYFPLVSIQTPKDGAQSTFVLCSCHYVGDAKIKYANYIFRLIAEFCRTGNKEIGIGIQACNMHSDVWERVRRGCVCWELNECMFLQHT